MNFVLLCNLSTYFKQCNKVSGSWICTVSQFQFNSMRTSCNESSTKPNPPQRNANKNSKKITFHVNDSKVNHEYDSWLQTKARNIDEMNDSTNSEITNLSPHFVSASHLVHQHRDRHKKPNSFDPSMFGF